MDTDGLIYHLMPRDDWDTLWEAQRYEPPSLKAEGFIHASSLSQVLATAERYFAGRDDIVLLCVDPSRLPGETVYEDLSGSGEAFPHVYGPIMLNSVIGCFDMLRDAGGRFELPSSFRT